LISGRKPSNAKLTVVAELGCLDSCWHVDKKQAPPSQSADEGLKKVRDAFPILLLVNEKIYLELDGYNILWPILVT